VRDEKKAAREEKDKKALEAQSKSRNLMANFFKKPKQPSGPVPSPSTSPNKALSSISDYDRIFKPFVLKKDASLASVNWFRRPLPDVIVLDDDGPKTNASEDTTTDSPPIPTDSTGVFYSLHNFAYHTKEFFQSICSWYCLLYHLPSFRDSPHVRTPVAAILSKLIAMDPLSGTS